MRGLAAGTAAKQTVRRRAAYAGEDEKRAKSANRNVRIGATERFGAREGFGDVNDGEGTEGWRGKWRGRREARGG